MGLLYNSLNKPNRQRDLAVAHSFRVSISGLYNAEFVGVSGLGGELISTEYREGGENSMVHRLPDYMRWDDVTLTKGVVRNDSDLWYWFRSALQLEGGMGFPARPRFLRDVTITGLNGAGKSIVIYRLYQAHIKRIQPGGFDSSVSAFHAISVVLGHNGLDAEYPIPIGNETANQLLNEGAL